MSFSPIQNAQFKVTVTHWGESVNYINDVFTDLNVKRRVNGYDVATLTASNKPLYYKYKAQPLDEVKIYFKDSSATAWQQVFGGYLRQTNPAFNPEGSSTQLIAKGYGAALEDTHCCRAYGSESDNPTLDTVKKILTDVVDNFVEKSLGSASDTGYSFTNKIADYASATPIKYVNNPFRSNMEVFDEICKLGSAIGAGAAGPEYIVDVNKNVLVNTIGAHEDSDVWPTWVNYTQADSTYIEGVDFKSAVVTDKAEEFANKVVLITDLRRPAYDSWRSSLWGNEDLTSITDDSTADYFVVGADSVKFTPNGATQGYGYYPSTADAAWDIEKLGSEKSIPTLNFYCRKKALTTDTTYVVLSTNSTARKTDYFYTKFMTWQSEADDKWYHKSIPIGPYWASANETKEYRWSEEGSPSWSQIDSIEFGILGAGAGGTLHIDDLHFTGKIARSAKNSTSIAAYKEFQKVLISREALDDSAIATDDTGYAARIAYAELLRRQKLPYTITFQLVLTPQMMPGQKCHVHAFKLSDGSFGVNDTFRIIEVEHLCSIAKGLASTVVSATTDLTNSIPISVPDQYQLAVENLLLNSGEAKNMRASNDVDLLIPVLEKDYPT